MTQTETYTKQSSFPLPDAFSAELTTLFTTVQPSIVQIHTEGRGAGTGIIWNASGHIITNNHVVAKDNSRIQVFLADGRTLDAKVLHRNPHLDLALLKATGENLKPLSAGDSSKLRVGEWVFAVGHPWGQRWVVTAGIVSTQRTAKIADGVTTQYIQSDVLLAPGNSGGPLLDTDGNVIGINAMIFGGDLAVAIPSNVVTNWLVGLTKRTMKLGVAVQTIELSDAILQSFNTLRTSGLLIVGIEETRQASDLLVGDIILTVAGKPVNDPAELRHILSQQGEATTVPFTIFRAGAIVSLNATVLVVENI
ncbi:MAG: hypothetical protein NVS4B12_10120 [Ktedonobacteraceae bacterium]